MLRGVNVGGHNKVSMAELTKTFASLGFTQVSTYLNSGNVVFISDFSKSQIGDLLKVEIQRATSIACEVIVLGAQDLDEIVSGNPFLRLSIDVKKLYVTFLQEPVGELDKHPIDAESFMPDEFSIHRAHVYIYCAQRYGDTKLSNSFWERKFGSPATTRNWNTVTKLAEISARMLNTVQPL